MPNKSKGHPQPSADTPPPAKRRPRCKGKVLDYEQQRVRCTHDGFGVIISGSISQHADNLCLGCIAAARKAGWKVTFQLEGEAALLPE
jgi:hypothetical protein